MSPWTTLGLGFITLSLLVVLVLSGVLLMIYYVPTTEQALASTNDLEYVVTLGAVVRAMHRWAGHAMVLVVFLHFLRVLFTAGYSGRGFNWIIGMGLFLITMGLAFTGYLLPWDQLSYWAVRVGTNLFDQLPVLGHGLKLLVLGGDEVGQQALTRFYALHVAILPLLLAILLVLHLWRIRRDKGLVASQQGESQKSDTLSARPHLTSRQGIIFFIVVAVILVVANLVPAPLGPAANLHNPSNPEKTPWYFLWLQEMVSYSATVGGLIFPLFLMVFMAMVPALDKGGSMAGRWFGGRTEKIIVLLTLLAATGLLVGIEALYLKADIRNSAMSFLELDLFNPATATLALSVLGFFLSGIITGSTRAAVLCSATVLIVAVIVFTVLGMFRGPGWELYWPWEEWRLVL
ncbi:MAG: hypothetical protein GXP49_12135 [Deltaproteobacteria bacterium]|nr:hypothetical protein [Deltaproteobacteria bacterium]